MNTDRSSTRWLRPALLLTALAIAGVFGCAPKDLRTEGHGAPEAATRSDPQDGPTVVFEAVQPAAYVDAECLSQCRATCDCSDMIGEARGACHRICVAECRKACTRPGERPRPVGHI
jgi:hypothetical protein